MTEHQAEASVGENNAEERVENEEQNYGSKFLSELMFSTASFHAVFVPVSITMILSALAVVYINTEETRQAGAEAFSNTYEVFDLEDGDSRQNFIASIANTLIIVSVICVMTFVVVLLYKYRCMKIFFGYMIFVTASLLGYFTSSMWIIAVEKYRWKIDKVSFALVMWNYAVVGTLAIFFPTGIPRWVTQGYLVGTSVVLAWQLSYFNEWTAWTLLIMLALYDLFAVLTPCGPLKALTNLMSQSGAPALPGLLYEASLPDNVQRPGRSGRDQQQEGENEAPDRTSEPNEERLPTSSQPEALREDGVAGGSSVDSNTVRASVVSHQTEEASENEDQPLRGSPHEESETQHSVSQDTVEARVPEEASSETNNIRRSTDMRKGKIPLALAKMYKLQVVDDQEKLTQLVPQGDRRIFSPEEIRSVEWRPKQLRSEVTVVFPARGGRIEKSPGERFSEGPRYRVFSRSGRVLREFVVNREGRVMQVVKRERAENDPKDNTIKLGLGDFIFYSVLVSKAALHSFTSFAACMLVILAGLGGTLILLAVHGKALPALPISIFLGVSVFLLTRYVMEPWIHEVLRLPFYV